jgi:hypothetical protein
LRYLSDRAVEFTTPAGADGLGTEGMLKASDVPIRGLVALNPRGEIDSERRMILRLPTALSHLGEALL